MACLILALSWAVSSFPLFSVAAAPGSNDLDAAFEAVPLLVALMMELANGVGLPSSARKRDFAWMRS